MLETIPSVTSSRGIKQNGAFKTNISSESVNEDFNLPLTTAVALDDIWNGLNHLGQQLML